MKYQNYIFDLYGTLIDIHTNEGRKTLWRQMTDIYACYGAMYTPEQLRADYARMVQEEESLLAKENGAQHPEIKLEKVFARLLIEAPHKCPTSARILNRNVGSDNKVACPKASDQLQKAFRNDGRQGELKLTQEKDGATQITIEELADSDWMHLLGNTFRCMSLIRLQNYPNTISTLEQLREAGARIYLLSNAQRIFTEAELDKAGLTEFFDGIYISSDKGVKKPEPRFLQDLLEEYHLDPAQSVMTGNDIEADIGIARACGIDSYLLNTDRRSKREIARRLAALPSEDMLSVGTIETSAGTAAGKENGAVHTTVIYDGDIAHLLDA